MDNGLSERGTAHNLTIDGLISGGYLYLEQYLIGPISRGEAYNWGASKWDLTVFQKNRNFRYRWKRSTSRLSMGYECPLVIIS